MKALAPGLHRWTARHPEWHRPDGFADEVASFALEADGDLLLVDPLLPDDDSNADTTLEALDALAARAKSTAIFITIGYHVRSAEPLAARYDASIHGPANVRKRLADDTRFMPLTPEDPDPALPGGVTAFAIGRPRRSELPLHFPSHDALAFGDALVTTPDGELRMWCQDHETPERVAFYRDRFAPTLEPMRALKVRRVLTTHGAPILARGAAALAAALDAPPWFRHG